MIESLEIMARPFLACLILTGMHAYLGLHVVQRGVIFVDLALAQLAAFGATIGFYFGFALHSGGSYSTALAFSLAGAALFSLLRHREQRIPQEAYIGICYAIAAAGSILILSRSPEGGEELKSLLVGHLLFVDWKEIAEISALYALIGASHWKLREPLLLISADPERAYAQGLKVRWWDFFFYGTFGVVVTSSTELGGVLLVFSFLIVPAVCGAMLAESVKGKLVIGWLTGAATSLAGILVSYQLDLPTGAAVVCMFGVTLGVCALASYLR